MPSPATSYWPGPGFRPVAVISACICEPKKRLVVVPNTPLRARVLRASPVTMDLTSASSYSPGPGALVEESRNRGCSVSNGADPVAAAAALRLVTDEEPRCPLLEQRSMGLGAVFTIANAHRQVP